MTLPKSRKDREQQKFVDDGLGNVAVRAVVIGGGGGGTPGSPTGSIQGNNAGSFAGVPGSTIDFTNGIIKINALNYNKAMRVPPPFFADFVEAILTGVNSNAAGGGTINFADSTYTEPTHAGHARLRVTAVNDVIGVSRNTTAVQYQLGGGIGREVQCCFRLPTLNDGANDWGFEVGFGDSTNTLTDFVDGVSIRYNNASANFQYGTRDNSVGSFTASSFPAIDTDHQFLRIVVNPAGTLASYYAMNDVDADWTLLGTLAVNIPTGAGRFLCPMFRAYKQVGATQREIFVDKFLDQAFL